MVVHPKIPVPTAAYFLDENYSNTPPKKYGNDPYCLELEYQYLQQWQLKEIAMQLGSTLYPPSSSCLLCQPLVLFC